MTTEREAEELDDMRECLRDALNEVNRYSLAMQDATETIERLQAEVARLRCPFAGSLSPGEHEFNGCCS